FLRTFVVARLGNAYQGPCGGQNGRRTWACFQSKGHRPLVTRKYFLERPIFEIKRTGIVDAPGRISLARAAAVPPERCQAEKLGHVLCSVDTAGYAAACRSSSGWGGWLARLCRWDPLILAPRERHRQGTGAELS